ncbi:hypothetical protein BDP27DRAFT_1383233 [Rhodocollybia butyracea]|uniref:Integrase catalytic domain-containing protein n=1 Tax=Rhodocollybia butyracea TaxID=206335 RepID=A0A9P5PTY5_9AGAR|nr:hypothetical protein BDP27DRAFT_1383233 [Rhodocollybia butyracea]
MPNYSGKNGYGDKNYPPDKVLKESLMKYSQRRLSREEKLTRLQCDHGLDIKYILSKIEKRLHIPILIKVASEDVKQAVVDEVDKDTMQNNGPNFVRTTLALKNVHIPRATIRKIMHNVADSGFDRRFSGRKVPKIPRKPQEAIGPFHQNGCDGHGKFARLALKMGNASISVYGYKDKWSDKILKLYAIPDCRSIGAIGHLWLDFVSEIGGIPITLTMDKGSEVGWQYTLQCVLREMHAPHIDPRTYPPAVQMKSVHHTTIEGFWKWLLEKKGLNIKDHILRGKTEHIFSDIASFHIDLFHWIFPPLVQEALDEFGFWWNEHCVRRQPEKIMPSGHIPADALEHPELYNGLNCLIKVPMESVNEL